MKKIYNEFFYVPQHGKGKVREKVMVTRIAFSVVLILVCMAAMSLTAYAYFSHNLTVNVVTIRTATWDITATTEDDVVISDDFYVLNNSSGVSEREFTITLAKTETETSATVGYVRIDVKTDIDGFTGVQTYYSQPIGEFLSNGEMTTDLDREIKIVVPAGKVAHVQFTGEWGSCAKEPIIDQIIEPKFAATVSTPTDTTTNTESEVTSDTQQTTTNPTETKPTESTTTAPTTDSTTTDTTASTQAETESTTSNTEVSSAPTTEESNEEN